MTGWLCFAVMASATSVLGYTSVEFLLSQCWLSRASNLVAFSHSSKSAKLFEPSRIGPKSSMSSR